MVTLREYEPRDREILVTLWWESWHSIRAGLRHPQPIDAWRRRFTDEIVAGQRIVVAEEAGRVVGFAAVDLADSELAQLFVDPRHKRRGVGGRLLDWARSAMPDGFNLHTLVENTASRAFYERHGLRAGAVRVNPVNGLETIEYRWAPTRAGG